MATEVIAVAAQNRFDPDLLLALVAAESSLDRTAVSRKGARGLGQVMFPTTCAVTPALIRRPKDLYDIRISLPSSRATSHFARLAAPPPASTVVLPLAPVMAAPVLMLPSAFVRSLTRPRRRTEVDAQLQVVGLHADADALRMRHGWQSRNGGRQDENPHPNCGVSHSIFSVITDHASRRIPFSLLLGIRCPVTRCFAAIRVYAACPVRTRRLPRRWRGIERPAFRHNRSTAALEVLAYQMSCSGCGFVRPADFALPHVPRRSRDSGAVQDCIDSDETICADRR